MEIKNIHNNPKESRPFGKVWGYIINGLRSLARPKKNTKWDYIVPLSLVGLQFLVMDYGIMNQYVQHSGEVITKSITEIKDTLIFELVYAVFVVLSIIFLTRLQRILILFISPIGAILLNILAKIFGFIYLEMIAFVLFFIPFFSVAYILSNISLLLKFGNNTTNKTNIRIYSLLRKVSAYAIYGFGIDISYLYTMNIISAVGGIDVVHGFIFERLSIPIIPFFPLYSFIFALIGYIIEKYKGGKIK